ncbi:lantibiotic dehydratase [Streptomyces scopuliridis]|uniref:Lantibiotic dehydratase n=1 Tax=Streptomyces scopuliridis TaxID=452529 RepID=A0ACD4ZFX9_9ACTN|nr:thiopeptide-type bacteriocin biosynthesis protein [Streptomyces scopuliridis]WSB96926.1 lantibiotic dehydratase [Streptomyces scopuliridis]WSC09370.1 lantibiotic dehydratase [Streptomyces scopuliridis]
MIRRSHESTSESERAACVAYRPRVMRSANVATVPQWLPHRIPLGVGPAATDGTEDLNLADLAVRADLDGLRLIDLGTGRRVRPVSYSMLNPSSGHLPHTARFLLELGQEGPHWCVPWNWGAWSAAPAQPRVTLGRTVLAPARWLPDRALRDAAEAAGRPWHGEVASWRQRWDVPRHIQLIRADNHIAVDLDDPLHLLVFQEELKRVKGLSVVERFDGARHGGWLAGPDGAHAAELVIPLLARPARKAPAPAPLSPAGVTPARRGAYAHVPGGEWLYAKLYVPEPFQARVLTRHLRHLTDPAVLAAAGADTWFVLRYADPEAHLRLRIHGKPAQLWPVLLPALRLWAEGLRDAGLADRLVLDTYDPEIERYGGSAVQARAERVFHADSAVVIRQLGLPTDDLADVPGRTALAALGILAILTRLRTEDEALGLLGNGERRMPPYSSSGGLEVAFPGFWDEFLRLPVPCPGSGRRAPRQAPRPHAVPTETLI